MQIIIYSTATSPYCKMAKDYLNEKKIAFTGKLIDQDDQAREEMKKKSGNYLGVPFILVTDNAGKETPILGFDKSKLNQALAIS